MTPPTIRYQCFLRAHAAHSIKAPPNYRFMSWINKQWNTYREQHPKTPSDQEAFDAWLLNQYPPTTTSPPAA